MRLVTPAVSWQLAGAGGRRLRRADGAIDSAPATVTGAVLELAGELAEHLRTPHDVREVGAWLDSGTPSCPAGRPSGPAQAARPPAGPGAAAAAGRGLQPAQAQPRGRWTTATRWRWPPGSRPPPRGRRDRAGPRSGRAARRIPGHQPRPAGAAARAVRRRPSGHRRGRSLPVHLRLARRLGGQPAALPRRLQDRAPDEPAPVRQLSVSFRNGDGYWTSPPGADPAPHGGQGGAGARTRCQPGRARPGDVRLPRDRRRRGGVDRRRDRQDLGAEAAPDGCRGARASARTSDRGGPRAQPQDVAILARKRSQFPALRKALESRGIPVEVVGLGGLLDRARGLRHRLPPCARSTTRPRETPWSGCSPDRGGGSAPPTSRSWVSGRAS